MTLYKITTKGPEKVPETHLKAENLLEENLENWICSNPDILGEPLLIIGRQVIVPDTKDRLDILAVDPHGNSVIIELKRGQLKDPVDTQALSYASYISKWRYENFENTSRDYYKKGSDPDYSFTNEYEIFCQKMGIDEIPELNEDQRIIIIGSDVKDRLGSVALWLRDHSIDIRLIEVHAYKEDNKIYIEPNQIVPLQVSKFTEVGKPHLENAPWLADGRTWHLEKKCSAETKESVLFLDHLIKETLNLEEPSWDQKYYIAYKVNNYNWFAIVTGPKSLLLQIKVKAGSFETKTLASELGIVEFDKDETLSEKLNLKSSLFISRRNEEIDTIRIRAKEDFNYASDAFAAFIKKAYLCAPNQAGIDRSNNSIDLPM
jgi:hypothetical protein